MRFELQVSLIGPFHYIIMNIYLAVIACTFKQCRYINPYQSELLIVLASLAQRESSSHLMQRVDTAIACYFHDILVNIPFRYIYPFLSI